MKRTYIPSDFGTPEFLFKNKQNLHQGYNDSGQKVARVITQTPLDYYYNRGLLNEHQYNAGNKFGELWFYGVQVQLGNMRMMKYGSNPSHIKPTFEQCVSMENSYRASLKEIRSNLVREVCIAVCCLEEFVNTLKKIYDKNKRMTYLRDGLDDLDQHFRAERRRAPRHER